MIFFGPRIIVFGNKKEWIRRWTRFLYSSRLFSLKLSKVHFWEFFSSFGFLIIQGGNTKICSPCKRLHCLGSIDNRIWMKALNFPSSWLISWVSRQNFMEKICSIFIIFEGSKKFILRWDCESFQSAILKFDWSREIS